MATIRNNVSQITNKRINRPVFSRSISTDDISNLKTELASELFARMHDIKTEIDTDLNEKFDNIEIEFTPPTERPQNIYNIQSIPEQLYQLYGNFNFNSVIGKLVYACDSDDSVVICRTSNIDKQTNIIGIYQCNTIDNLFQLDNKFVWLIDNNKLVNGQLIQSSKLFLGYAVIQSDDIVHNYTIGSIVYDIDGSYETRYIDLENNLCSEVDYNASNNSSNTVEISNKSTTGEISTFRSGAIPANKITPRPAILKRSISTTSNKASIVPKIDLRKTQPLTRRLSTTVTNLTKRSVEFNKKKVYKLIKVRCIYLNKI